MHCLWLFVCTGWAMPNMEGLCALSNCSNVLLQFASSLQCGPVLTCVIMRAYVGARPNITCTHLAVVGVVWCLQAITEHGLYQRTPDQIPDGEWGKGMVTLVGDAAHTAYVDGTGLALSLGRDLLVLLFFYLAISEHCMLRSASHL